MTIGDMMQQAGMNLPQINVSAVGNWIVIIGIAVFIAALLGLGIFALIMFLKYNKIIRLFKKIGSSIQLVGSDKGMFERISVAGDYWLRTRKFKKVLARPKLQMTKNEYWYYEREDGEWMNFVIDDIDELLKEASVKYIDEDMRLQRLGIQKNLEKRYAKTSFWDKYGNAIMGIGFVLLVTICLIILFNKLDDLVKTFPQAAEAIAKMADAVNNIATRQGSGMVPINETII